LLCRLTNFKVLGAYDNTDMKQKIEDPGKIEETDKDPESPYHYFVLAVKKIG